MQKLFVLVILAFALTLLVSPAEAKSLTVHKAHRHHPKHVVRHHHARHHRVAMTRK